MNVFSLLALLLTIAGWVLTLITGVTLLSGPYEERICHTACVQVIFFSGVAAGAVGLLLGLVSLLRSSTRKFSYLVLALAIPLCAIFAMLILIGSLA